MSAPFLIGRRVQLRPIEESDAETFVRWMNDPEMRNYLLVRFPLTLQSEKEWIANMTPKAPTPRNIVLAIERRRDSLHIGSVGLHQIDWLHRRATTGSIIYPASLRNKGYATEAKELLLDYAFGELGMVSIWSIAHANNPASQRALEKQGYRKNGVWRKATLVKGEWLDAVYYDILREEWQERRRGSVQRSVRSTKKGRSPRPSKKRRAARSSG
jgi:RimJ/RimL family protein N-acetyltransferase